MWRGGFTSRWEVDKGENPALAGAFRTLRFWVIVSSIVLRESRRNSVRVIYVSPSIEEV